MTDPGIGDASRRTWLASERTFLAWARNSLAAFAVAIAIGGILPRLTPRAADWPYAVAGGGFGGLGIAYLTYGLLRQRALDALLPEGGFLRVDPRVTIALAIYTMVLGLYTTVMVLINA